jgi:hypothetical protein
MNMTETSVMVAALTYAASAVVPRLTQALPSACYYSICTIICLSCTVVANLTRFDSIQCIAQQQWCSMSVVVVCLLLLRACTDNQSEPLHAGGRYVNSNDQLIQPISHYY